MKKGDCGVKLYYAVRNYHLYLFDKVLFKVPQMLGKRLFKHGLAIEKYTNVELAGCADSENETTEKKLPR